MPKKEKNRNPLVKDNSKLPMQNENRPPLKRQDAMSTSTFYQRGKGRPPTQATQGAAKATSTAYAKELEQEHGVTNTKVEKKEATPEAPKRK